MSIQIVYSRPEDADTVATLEVDGLIVLLRQRLCLHIPLDYEYRRTC